MCARTQLEAHDRDWINRRLRDGISWNGVLQTALRHRVAGLVYRHLRGMPAGTVAGNVLEALRGEHLLTATRNLRLMGELREILKQFDAHGVSGIPFKGPLLAIDVYGDPALRSFGDLDILVRKEDLPAARQILATRGYLRAQTLTSGQQAALYRSGHEDVFVRDGEFVVELQWQPAKAVFQISVDLAAWWARAENRCLAGRPVRTLARDDLLLLLCVHGSRHAWERLTWICDVAETIRNSPHLNWGAVVSQASESRLSRSVRLGLYLAEHLLDAPVPDSVSRWIRQDATVPRLAEVVCTQLFAGRSTPAHYLRLQFGLRETLMDRIRLGYHSAFTPTHDDWAYVRLPDPFYRLYYVIRPVRLLSKYAGLRITSS